MLINIHIVSSVSGRKLKLSSSARHPFSSTRLGFGNFSSNSSLLNSVLPPPREQNFCLIWGSSRTLVELPKEGDSFQACKLGNLTLNYDQLSHAPTFANLPFLPRLHQPIFHFPLSTTAKTLFVMKCEYRTLTYLDK